MANVCGLAINVSRGTRLGSSLSTVRSIVSKLSPPQSSRIARLLFEWPRTRMALVDVCKVEEEDTQKKERTISVKIA